jgi:transposase
VLDVKPAVYFVRVTKREKRACKRCEEQGVAVAPAPECIIPKSLVSDQVIIDTAVASIAIAFQSIGRARSSSVIQVSTSASPRWTDGSCKWARCSSSSCA